MQCVATVRARLPGVVALTSRPTGYHGYRENSRGKNRRGNASTGPMAVSNDGRAVVIRIASREFLLRISPTIWYKYNRMRVVESARLSAASLRCGFAGQGFVSGVGMRCTVCALFYRFLSPQRAFLHGLTGSRASSPATEYVFGTPPQRYGGSRFVPGSRRCGDKCADCWRRAKRSSGDRCRRTATMHA